MLTFTLVSAGEPAASLREAPACITSTALHVTFSGVHRVLFSVRDIRLLDALCDPDTSQYASQGNCSKAVQCMQ